ncbi:hypothetical protein SAMN03159382_02396 [Pseudomonas sp. NFACC23-1]|uniref:hypothetical protein n=1 Tax=unclassified Pseudomonas TaxID=196821 RepID=UPI00088D98BC|nr:MULTISPECIES: hypothetical protein [unclassified Pseudomonas]SDB28278.1 hypothetical protein SAMN03159386_02056 [Pseudomonas sp. NFACC17-2]SEJ41486.1 hypothetical protein SAMN03159382_02396 [Pseudomonas sp. NFACC23-1]SFW66583.1 hypothetical protein SAMN05660640_02604 [Pseudomonas sp. NFACC16-2]
MNNGKSFPWNLDLTGFCDQCGKYRAHGNHYKCSKARQAINERRRAEEARSGVTPGPKKSASVWWLLRQE